MLKTRVITAIIGVILLAVAITYGGLLFNLVMSVLAFIAWVECVSLFRHMKRRVLPLWGLLYIVLVFGSLVFGNYPLAVFLGVLVMLAMVIEYTFCNGKITLMVVQSTISSLLYVTSGFIALMVLRDNRIYENTNYYAAQEGFGTAVIWLVLIATWASDTFAYFVGRSFGKRNIVPTISPNKTLEGFIGGFIGCILTGWIGSFSLGLPVNFGVGIGVIVGILAPLGDLFESKLKREANRKDSGTLLPGHGGVLDRFDSLLFAAPLVLAYILML
ncbi:phosphatidate cytidylyltransferase [Veillonella sp. VA142]|uniref:phosphatidate cytidylyltransferase n=1 Tax=Veillonella sp. VA142 TaxID=741834 RepID=UPI000F8D388D|nr:phosphatidate cytidylyltransferase [Veillonella sp. VA142]